VPRRRCVGCGRIASKSELVRLALAGEGRPRHAVIDPAGTLPGRGAYLCRAGTAEPKPKPDCLQLAERRRGIARTLRCSVTLAPEIVESVNQ
jgi:predicted RNA-binding protein YlxR (DUF448 family)